MRFLICCIALLLGSQGAAWAQTGAGKDVMKAFAGERFVIDDQCPDTRRARHQLLLYRL